jgi:hypothetical protein
MFTLPNTVKPKTPITLLGNQPIRAYFFKPIPTLYLSPHVGFQLIFFATSIILSRKVFDF